jgi:hypothetical protein
MAFSRIRCKQHLALELQEPQQLELLVELWGLVLELQELTLEPVPMCPWAAALAAASGAAALEPVPMCRWAADLLGGLLEAAPREAVEVPPTRGSQQLVFPAAS